MKKYLLDSNIFIEAHRKYYPFDVVPSFWNKLIDLFNRELICSIDKVQKELCNSNNPDELALWCENKMNKDFFVDTSSYLDKYVDITLWLQSNNYYNQKAKEEFLTTDLADPWLIACAMKQNYIIVTHEVSKPGKINKIKIPDACSHFNIQYTTTIQMFRDLGETF